MTYRSNYVPKKRKVNYKIVVLFSIILTLIIGGTVYYYSQKPTETSTDFSICGLSSQASFAKATSQSNDHTVNMADHAFYGQSLAVFKETYDINKLDSFSSETAIIKNLCNDKEQVFLLGLKLDETIPLAQLDEGFYEIQIMDGFYRSRVTTETALNDTFTTAVRNGKAKQIRLVSDARLFEKDETQVMDKNYVFIEVKNVDVDPEVVDIILDPNGLIETSWGGISYGVNLKEFIESDEMYRLAEAVKSELINRGYRASVSRGNESPLNINGDNGRLARAYSAEAKYYVHFKAYESSIPFDTGGYIIHSSKSSNRFSNAIMKEVIANTDLEIYIDDETTPGVLESNTIDGIDKNDIIREAGGRMTYAGLYDVYAELNGFAKDRDRGMETLVFVLGNMSNSESQEIWKTQFDQIVVAIADGISYELGSE